VLLVALAYATRTRDQLCAQCPCPRQSVSINRICIPSPILAQIYLSTVSTDAGRYLYRSTSSQLEVASQADLNRSLSLFQACLSFTCNMGGVSPHSPLPFVNQLGALDSPGPQGPPRGPGQDPGPDRLQDPCPCPCLYPYPCPCPCPIQHLQVPHREVAPRRRLWVGFQLQNRRTTSFRCQQSLIYSRGC